MNLLKGLCPPGGCAAGVGVHLVSVFEFLVCLLLNLKIHECTF